jgi:pimeloyl-ACP methyl ester carboxylesterase
MPREKVSIEGYAAMLDALCDHLDIESAAVVGNSMGGFVSAELAIKFETRVTRLVLVSAAGLSTKYVGVPSHVWRRRWVVAFARAVNAYARIPDARAETLLRRPRLRRGILDVIVRYPQRLPAPLLFELIRGSGRPAAPDAADALASYDFRDSVERIHAPTLLVWGRQDRVVPAHSADEYERLLPNAEKVIFEDTGHLPMLERPARFNALLESFLSG